MSSEKRTRVLDFGGELRWEVGSSIRQARRPVCRNRHGRGPRGVLVPVMLPRYRSRREVFNELVIQEIRNLAQACPQIRQVSFGVEDVPPSDPAPWENSSVVLSRGFGADPGHGLPAQVVIYRRPLEQRVTTPQELREIIHAVILEESAQLIGVSPEEIDPRWTGL